MRRSNLKKVFLATLAAVLVLGAAACGQEKTTKTEETTTVADSAASKPEGSGGSETADPYYIAWAAPLTGDNANAGQEGLTALNMAIDEFNAAGGYEGHKSWLIRLMIRMILRRLPILHSRLFPIRNIWQF